MGVNYPIHPACCLNAPTVIPANAGTQGHTSLPQRLKPKVLSEIRPLRIMLFDQLQLPSTPPFLDPLLPKNRSFHIVMSFEPNQFLDAKLLRESAKCATAMLGYSRSEIGCDTKIESTIALGCEQVNGRLKDALQSSGFPRSRA